jgi:hypothetical protein
LEEGSKFGGSSFMTVLHWTMKTFHFRYSASGLKKRPGFVKRPRKPQEETPSNERPLRSKGEINDKQDSRRGVGRQR